MRNPGSTYRNLAALVSVLFGLSLVANTHPMGDGSWFWYADALRRGTRLYADLHLALQPLFILQTEATMSLLGKGWLASKVPAVLEMVAYIVGLRMLAGRLPLPDWQRGLLSATAFFLGTLFAAYRFDDYHVPTDALVVYSILALLHLRDRGDCRWPLLFLGIASGLAFTMRLNDGAALILSVLASLFVILPAKRWRSIPLYAGTAVVTVLAIVHLTGDTVVDYATYSVFHAAASKGGTGSILRAPMLFPLKTLHLLLITPQYLEVIGAALIACGLGWIFRRWPVVVAAFFVLVGLFGSGKPFSQLPAEALAGIWMLIMLATGAIVIFRLVSHLVRPQGPVDWNPAEILFLVPLGQLLSGSMSSGGVFIGIYSPIGPFILLLPALWPLIARKTWRISPILMAALITLVSTAIFKARLPFSWHTYVAKPMFVGRQWYRHPLYGPMFIEKTQLEYINGVCTVLSQSDSKSELLSLPFTYANYFCGIPPWQGYVQTFFDTIAPNTIPELMDRLARTPPKWILYQRQLGIVELHELIYNHRQPIPHRDLDRQIVGNLDNGSWHAVNTWSPDPPNTKLDPLTHAEWILIRTR